MAVDSGGACREPVRIENPDRAVASVTIPQVSAPATIHVILELELSNYGVPPLTSYSRVVLIIKK